MKQITQWMSEDGCIFNTSDACAAYEHLCVSVRQTIDKFPSGELKDGEYRQLNRETVLIAQRQLVDLFRTAVPHLANSEHVLWARDADRPAGLTMIGRYMDDAAPLPLRRAWFRIMCIDSKFREWSQPYYALQADK